MALETGTYISDLVSTNPAASDNISQGDDHIRLVKATIKATFPNIAGAVTTTHTELSTLGSTGTPTFGGATLESTSATASAGPVLDLFRNSASPAASDILGRLTFSGEDAVGSKNDYAYIEGVLVSPTNGSENGALRFQTLLNGSMSEAMRIDESGRLLMGTTSYLDGWNTSQNIVLAGTSNPGINIFQGAASTAPGVLTFNKSRGAPGSVTSVASGDTIGAINFAGADSINDRVSAARISGEVDGTPGYNDMPGRLVFSTTADGASSVTERMRIRSDGGVGIGSSGSATASLLVAKDATGGTGYNNVQVSSEIKSGVTATYRGVLSSPSTAAASFTTGSLQHFVASGVTLGAGSAVTTQYGFVAQNDLTAAGTNIGFYSAIPSSTGDWNFYAAGTAQNYFAGNVGIATTSPDAKLSVNGVASFGDGVASAPSIANFGDLDTGMYFPAANTIAFSTGGTEEVRITSVGRVGIGTTTPSCSLDVVGGIKTDRSSVTSPASTDGNIFSGTYTPTLTSVTNIGASTAFQCQYMRVGNVVTVSGKVNIDPTTSGILTELGMSLPVASDITAAQNIGGTFAYSDATTGNAGLIRGATSTDTAIFEITPSSNANRGYHFSFTYLVQ